jgi:choline dehydrogenase-like flavoprotein
MEPNLNWGYKTTPQEHCNGREIDYCRGKCLGGSSAINFGVYTVGARDDYDRWAAEVGDSTFNWKNMQSRFKALETFSGEIARPEHQRYGAPQTTDHGDKGALGIGYAAEWESDLPLILDAFEQAGLPRNLDHNSGNPIGMSLMINSVRDGVRTTAADLVKSAPDNLVFMASSPVQRVIIEGNKAVGVESNGKQCKSLSSNTYLGFKQDSLTLTLQIWLPRKLSSLQDPSTPPRFSCTLVLVQSPNSPNSRSLSSTTYRPLARA